MCTLTIIRETLLYLMLGSLLGLSITIGLAIRRSFISAAGFVGRYIALGLAALLMLVKH